jgi:hypothetical protein
MQRLKMPTADGTIRYRIVRSLGMLQSIDPSIAIDRPTIEAAIEETLRSAFRDLDWRLSLRRAMDEDASRRSPALDLLALLLRDKETDALSRICHLLGLLYPHERFARIHRGLTARSSKVRASSRELLENILKPPLRAPVLALSDEASDEDRLARAGAMHRSQPISFEQLLDLATARGGEMEALARYYRSHAGSPGVKHAS